MNHAVEMMSAAECRLIDRGDGDGIGALSTAKGNLPLAALKATTRIVGLFAHTELEQTFINQGRDVIEATYIFPLPSRAAVTDFVFEVAGRVVRGDLKERGAAREHYDRAIASGHRAAISEEDRAGVFTMRVGNLPPGERATVRLTMTGPLEFDDGEVTFRFPLVVAPRYIPGAPLGGESVGSGTAVDTDAVPDASRITPPVLLPGFPSPVKLALAVEIEPTALAIGSVRSSLHAVTPRQSDGRVRIELQPGERVNRDFVLRYQIGSTSAVQSTLQLAEGANGEGTFIATIVPPVGLAKADRPRDVAFVLDRSGSMCGWKIVAARRAVARMIDTLRSGDRFSVLAFDDQIESIPGHTASELIDATDRNRFRAIEFLANIDGEGGTEMREPLEIAADSLAGGYADRERILVLVTDGQVGNEDQILKRLAKRIKNVRVFTLGVDTAVNEAFLTRLAAMGGGATELVESEDRLDEVMDRIHRRISAPVVAELTLTAEGMTIDEVFPRRVPDLFAGKALVVTGRYRSAGRTPSVRLSGVDAAGMAYKHEVQATRVTADEPKRAIGASWARSALRELEDDFILGRGDLSALEQRLVAISLAHRVLCRFTAFVAVDESAKVKGGGTPRVVTQAVELPQGWAQFGGSPDEEVLVMAECEPMEALASMQDEECDAFDEFAAEDTDGGRAMGESDQAFAPPAPMPTSNSVAAPRRAKSMRAGAPMQSVAKSRAAGPGSMSRQSPPSRGGGGYGGGKMMEEAMHEVEAPVASIDLSPYRVRFDRIIADGKQRLTSADLAARGFVIARIIRDLSDLAADLTSVAGASGPRAGLPATLSEALKAAVAALRSALESGAAGKVEDWSKALDTIAEPVIAAFADQDVPPPSTRRSRLAFWK